LRYSNDHFYFHGIEKMKRDNNAFADSLDLFKAVFEKAPDIAVNLINKDYTVLWANKIMAAGVSRTLDEMIGKPCYQVFRRNDKPCQVCVFQTVIRTKKPHIMERSLDLPDEERRYSEVRAYPIFDMDGSVKHVFEICIPLDKKKKDEDHQRKYIESLEKSIRELNANSPADSKQKVSKNGSITARELEILRLIARGFSNKEIAGILNISLDTVKTHIRNIFFKLDVKDRTRAAVWASSHNLI
jgi:DNA-binding CsgD family transcriptional regulator